MRVLVTGARGFVGGHLSSCLRAEHPDVEVFGLVRPRGGAPGRAAGGAPCSRPTSTTRAAVDGRGGRGAARPHRPPGRAVQRAPLLDRPGGDAAHERAWASSTSWRRCAAPSLRPRVLVVGSAEEYGAVADGRACRCTRTRRCGPVSPYAVSKVAQGSWPCSTPCPRGLPVLRTRTFHHTGPGRGEAFAESSFARQIAEVEAGRRPPVLSVGNLDAVRDFTDVRDVVRAYWAAPGARRARARSTTSAAAAGVRIGDVLRRLLALSGVAGRGPRGPRAASARPTSRRSWATPRRLQRGHGLGAAHPAASARCADLLDDWRERVAARPRRAGGRGEGPAHRAAPASSARTWPAPSPPRGHELRVLAREGSNLAGLPAGAEIVRGDVTDARRRARAPPRAARPCCTWRRW